MKQHLQHLKYLGYGLALLALIGTVSALFLLAIALLIAHPVVVFPIIGVILAYFTGRNFVKFMEEEERLGR